MTQQGVHLPADEIRIFEDFRRELCANGNLLCRRRLLLVSPAHKGLESSFGDECRAAVGVFTVDPLDCRGTCRAFLQAGQDRIRLGSRCCNARHDFGVECRDGDSGRRGRHGFCLGLHLDLDTYRAAALYGVDVLFP